ncbi:RIP metalloprotease RseP [Actibacterium sp. XHP0104]|uniref:RIP metalloprotease RseP n=1 Tax=Actibacterium sp. XHP0104 TaxID=2984335 RepID=UPI0021E7B747|nr:RIP metalloprotease RseP [Actibacterium sp. XHP0104]MCV2881135.1 RIP metalloprotease RseP [Actibacterium sp. XHP0104]
MDIAGLIPTFGNAAYTLVAFVVALSIIVTVHEYGHYIVGRLSGIHAEVFSIGFGPVLLSRHDKWGTKWQIAALPFGGYVKFLGDAGVASDRASDVLDDMDAETLRHTMHGAPLWARAATVIAGPAFNFALSIFVFSAVILVDGEAVEPPTIGKVQNLPVATTNLQPGDSIVAIEGTDTPDYATFYGLLEDLPVTSQLFYTVERPGEEPRLQLGPYPFPPLVRTVQPQSAAMDAGLAEGDVILAVDGQEISAFKQLQEIVSASNGAQMTLTIWRDGTEHMVRLAPRRVDLPLADGGFETRWLIGMTGGLFFEPETRTPGVGTALGYGLDQTVFIVKSSISGLYHMVTGAISSCNLRGPLGIAQTSGAAASQGISSFIWFIAMLSTAVGLLNLFPIPVLDGGHLVFHVYEALTGRPPSDRALRTLMGVGLSLMLGLMVFALTNDLFCP